VKAEHPKESCCHVIPLSVTFIVIIVIVELVLEALVEMLEIDGLVVEFSELLETVKGNTSSACSSILALVLLGILTEALAWLQLRAREV